MNLGISLLFANYGLTDDSSSGVSYFQPVNSQIDYYAAQGFSNIRVPVDWERLQPDLNGPLDQSVVTQLRNVIEHAQADGMQVVIDIHNYGAYKGDLVGSSAVPNSAFADLWGKIAHEFAGSDNVLFGLMNEPQQPSAAGWLEATNDAIAAIRHAGATQQVLVEGVGWNDASMWTTGGNAATIGAPGAVVDPLHNFAFEVHQYLDDGSGQHDWVVSETIGVERLTAITNWAKANGAKLYLGEVGVADNATSLAALTNMLDYVQANQDVWQSVSYWAGGSAWNNYMYSAEPSIGLLDSPQMDVLENYTDTSTVRTSLAGGSVRVDTFVDGHTSPSIIDTLDSSGALVSRTVFGTDGSIQRSLQHTGDGNYSVNTYGPGGSSDVSGVEIYDSSLHRMSQTEWNSDHSAEKKIYDSTGENVRTEHYNPQGQLISSFTNLGDGHQRYETYYADSGHLITQQILDLNFVPQSVVNYRDSDAAAPAATTAAPTPTISLSGAVSHNEGASGSTGYDFTVTRVGDLSAASSATWAVTGSGGHAANAADFVGGVLPSGTVSFASGQNTATVHIDVAGDAVAESDEGFTVTLSNPGHAVVDGAAATGTIVNDDTAPIHTPPVIALSGAVSHAEGASGATGYDFTVTRTGDLSAASSATWAVTGSGAHAANAADFVGGALPGGTVSFASGQDSAVVHVGVAGDTAVESDEGFTVTLSGPSSATLGGTTATGTIVNDDVTPTPTPPPVIALSGAVSHAEGASGSTGYDFTVTRTGDLSAASSATWAVTGSGAHAASAGDFVGGVLPGGTVSFASGQDSAIVHVGVAGDTAVESDEGFTVTLSGPSSATLGGATASGTIVNDDATPPVIALSGSVSHAEGASGATGYDFTVTRTGDLSAASSATWAVTGSGGHAASASDFVGGVLPGGTVTFASGQDSAIVHVGVTGDTAVESDEGFTVTLSGPSSATLGGTTATGTILNDDVAPIHTPPVIALSGAVSHAEGASGATGYDFTVTRTGDLSAASSATWAVTGSGTHAASAGDFVGGVLPGGTVSFASGEDSAIVHVGVAGDTVVESDEAFTVTLSGPSSATLGGTTATGTILNDDVSSTPTPTPSPTPTPTPTPSSGSGGSSSSPPALSHAPTEFVVTGLVFHGDDGPQHFDGGADSDMIVGGAGQETVRGMDGDDLIQGGAGSDDLNGNVGADTVQGGADADTVRGGKGDDQVFGDDGDDAHVNGNLGDDIVHGGAGNDTAYGGQGDDTVLGDEGDDVISGDLGDDILTGGAGADRFAFAAGSGHDWITDFSSAEGDRISLAPGLSYHLTEYQGQTMIELSDGSTIGLVGVPPSELGDWLAQG